MEVSNKKDKNLKKKQKSRAFKRGVLIVLNALLGCYFVYSVTGAIINYCQRLENVNPENFIKLPGLDKQDSLKQYKKVVKYDDSVGFISEEATSFTYYGGYLNFRNSNDTLHSDGSLNHSSYSRYVLRNVFDNREYEERYDFKVDSYLNSGIDLLSSDIKEGTYIVYVDNYEEKIPIKISSSSGIYETIYTPLVNNVRRKIEIRSNKVSPCLIINVKDILETPSSYSDINVVINTNHEESVKTTLKETDYKVRYFEKKHPSVNLVELNSTSSTYTIIIEEGNDIVVSNYVDLNDSLKPNIIDSGSLIGLDDDVYIRELGGDIFSAGRGYDYKDGENKYLSPYIDNINIGSLVIKVGIEKIGEISNILANI